MHATPSRSTRGLYRCTKSLTQLLTAFPRPLAGTPIPRSTRVWKPEIHGDSVMLTAPELCKGPGGDVDYETFTESSAHSRRTTEHLINLLRTRVDKTPNFSLFLGAG